MSQFLEQLPSEDHQPVSETKALYDAVALRLFGSAIIDLWDPTTYSSSDIRKETTANAMHLLLVVSKESENPIAVAEAFRVIHTLDQTRSEEWFRIRHSLQGAIQSLMLSDAYEIYDRYAPMGRDMRETTISNPLIYERAMNAELTATFGNGRSNAKEGSPHYLEDLIRHAIEVKDEKTLTESLWQHIGNSTEPTMQITDRPYRKRVKTITRWFARHNPDALDGILKNIEDYWYEDTEGQNQQINERVAWVTMAGRCALSDWDVFTQASAMFTNAYKIDGEDDSFMDPGNQVELLRMDAVCLAFLAEDQGRQEQRAEFASFVDQEIRSFVQRVDLGEYTQELSKVFANYIPEHDIDVVEDVLAYELSRPAARWDMLGPFLDQYFAYCGEHPAHSSKELCAHVAAVLKDNELTGDQLKAVGELGIWANNQTLLGMAFLNGAGGLVNTDEYTEQTIILLQNIITHTFQRRMTEVEDRANEFCDEIFTLLRHADREELTPETEAYLINAMPVYFRFVREKCQDQFDGLTTLYETDTNEAFPFELHEFYAEMRTCIDTLRRTGQEPLARAVITELAREERYADRISFLRDIVDQALFSQDPVARLHVLSPLVSSVGKEPINERAVVIRPTYPYRDILLPIHGSRIGGYNW